MKSNKNDYLDEEKKPSGPDVKKESRYDADDGRDDAETAGTVIEKGRRCAGQKLHAAFKILLFLLAGVLFIVILQPQIPDVITALDKGKGISAEELMNEKGGSQVMICLVYSEHDSWAPDECRRLAEKIQAEYDIHTDVAEDSSLSAFSENLYDLTISVGYTALNRENYLSCYNRLGADGYEISHTENADGRTVAVNIIAFREGTCRIAADRFADYFLKSGRLFRSADRLYVSVTHMDPVFQPVVIPTGEVSDVSILTVTKPGFDRYSLSALDALIRDSGPSLVVFCGGLDCGCSGRTELAEAWSGISALLALRDVPFCCVFAYEDGQSAISKQVISEVVESCGGHVGNGLTRTSGDSDDNASGGRTCIVFENKGEIPVYALYMMDYSCFSGTDGVSRSAEWMKTVDGILERTSGRDVQSGIVFPGILDCVASELPDFGGDRLQEGVTVNESTDGCSLPYGTLLYETVASINTDCCIFTAGNTNTGVLLRTLSVFDGEPGSDNSVSLGLTGSLDFNAYGLGGRFELNNSLRGGLILTLQAGSGTSSLIYRYAADLGAVKR